ncbi:RNA polymerase II-associated protein 3 isoform X2 [Poeciliopsis prolifica]|uniref:RNA polymerase II-associated protein 3 isoform X2 n=1 Tax=Poeciliopsis prolifica TaxID=188132 RepID=UPI002413D873|nr:RNA polymerase II-associated protein 3 isoform X2 [Poeciliopsis prolifica]
MPKKKELDRGGPSVPRIRQDSRLMRTHESIVDLMSGRRTSILEALAQPFLSLQFAQVLEDDLIYSDDDDDYCDDNDDDYHPPYAASKPLEPHPQIKQLTDEEADKIAKELIEEEDRRKEKTERNKRKKKRKKEKKRLEKESALKENLPENNEEESIENEEPTHTIDDNSEENQPPESDQSQTASKDGGCIELAGKDIVKINATEDKQQNDLNLKNLNAASTKLVPEEKSNLKSKKEKKKEKSKVVEVQQPEDKNLHVAEKPEVQMKSEPETNNEKLLGPLTEELAKRSVELASMGNRLAASGQYDMAVSCFTDAIKYNPKEFKLFGNRSLCYERLEQYENALRDADLALSMQPKWIKGLFRKGKALCGLKRYYEASLIYKDVLTLESSSVEAAQELKRTQTLHLMEMGFSWAQSTEALKAHPTLEEAVETLFARNRNKDPGGARAIWDKFKQTSHQDDNDEDEEEEEEDDDDGEWTVLQTARPRTQQVKDTDCLGQIRSKSQSPTPRSRGSAKPELFSVWVGTLGPTVTYPKLHQLFSRVGTIYSIKMLLEQQCAFVNYTRREDCERAIQCIDGMILDGAPLTVRYPFKGNTGETESYQRLSTYKKECFFWRTTGCTRDDCTFRHIPEHKNIDRDKFTSRLGLASYAGN